MPTTTSTRQAVARYQRGRLQRVAVTHPMAFAIVSATKRLCVDIPKRLLRRS